MKKEPSRIYLRQYGNSIHVKKGKKSFLVRHYFVQDGKLGVREQHVPNRLRTIMSGEFGYYGKRERIVEDCIRRANAGEAVHVILNDAS